ncbi:MAG: PEGA domain-containing protein [Labilithrix sp.]|nr:PEGA domain-containing protein [Labilithrix sp.]
MKGPAARNARIAWALAAVVSLSSVTSIPRTAAAQPRPRPSPAPPDNAAQAAQLKKQGDAHMDAERYAEAAQTYARAYALTSDPALLYNEGRALEALGEYPDAIKRLEQFRSSASPALLARTTGLDELITDLRGRVSTLAVTANVSGAQLLVRSKVVSRLEPSAEVSVRAGPATIEVTAEGYEPFTKEIDLRPRETTKLDVHLEERQTLVIVAVRSQPTDSDVFIDGIGSGRSPVEARVTSGTHVVTVSRRGYDDERVEVTIGKGERRDLDVTLKEKSGVTSRWWFWTGLGVIVAGGAAVAILAATGSRTRDPLPGDFTGGPIPAGFRF